jgi:hypothetical protein
VPQLSGLSIYLLNRMTQSHHIATRRFCRATGGVPGKFCLVHPQQEVTLLLQTFNCSRVELFFKLHNPLYGYSG